MVSQLLTNMQLDILHKCTKLSPVYFVLVKPSIDIHSNRQSAVALGNFLCWSIYANNNYLCLLQ